MSDAEKIIREAIETPEGLAVVVETLEALGFLVLDPDDDPSDYAPPITPPSRPIENLPPL